jgi:signal transduction histidine kinase
MGLANMRERAESLPAGTFEFRSTADGTRVGVRFAITENSNP